MKSAGEEDVLRQEAPVDRPGVEEGTGEVKGGGKVLGGVERAGGERDEEEREGKEDLELR
jgi:hypothetical protein